MAPILAKCGHDHYQQNFPCHFYLAINESTLHQALPNHFQVEHFLQLHPTFAKHSLVGSSTLLLPSGFKDKGHDEKHYKIRCMTNRLSISFNTCHPSNFITFLVVVAILKFILKLRFPTDVSFRVVAIFPVGHFLPPLHFMKLEKYPPPCQFRPYN